MQTPTLTSYADNNFDVHSESEFQTPRRYCCQEEMDGAWVQGGAPPSWQWQHPPKHAATSMQQQNQAFLDHQITSN